MECDVHLVNSRQEHDAVMTWNIILSISDICSERVEQRAGITDHSEPISISESDGIHQSNFYIEITVINLQSKK